MKNNHLQYEKFFYEMIKEEVEYTIKKYHFDRYKKWDNDDALQDIFIMCLDGLKRYTPKTLANGKKSSLKSYMSTIIRGGLHGAIRKEYINKKMYVRDDDPEYPKE